MVTRSPERRTPISENRDHGDVTFFEVLDVRSEFDHLARTLMAEHHGRAHNEVSDATTFLTRNLRMFERTRRGTALYPVVHVAATDTNALHFDQHLLNRRQMFDARRQSRTDERLPPSFGSLTGKGS